MPQVVCPYCKHVFVLTREPTKKIVLLKLLAEYFKSGDPSTVELAREIGRWQGRVWLDLRHLQAQGYVKCIREGRRCYWRVTEGGLHRLEHDGLIRLRRRPFGLEPVL